jgi:5-methylcytosine-specific restriction endonuclease McrA
MCPKCIQCHKKNHVLNHLNSLNPKKKTPWIWNSWLSKTGSHSSPFINVVTGVFFVVRVTLVPVSYKLKCHRITTVSETWMIFWKFVKSVVRIQRKNRRLNRDLVRSNHYLHNNHSRLWNCCNPMTLQLSKFNWKSSK